MSYKTAFGEVLRAYEKDRDKAQRDADARRDAVYAQIPRLREIDIQISVIGASLARFTLESGVDVIENARAEIKTLNDEKNALLKSSRIPENFLEVTHKCNICKDTGFIETENNYAERCVCLRQRLIEKYYDLSNMKKILKDENFDNFVLDYYSASVNEDEGISPNANMQTIYRTIVKFVNEFGKNFQNLFLYGASGLGKTFMCNCIAKELLDKGFTVLYMTAPRMFKIIEDFRFHRSETDDSGEMGEMVETASEVDLLIIDDLGAEFDTKLTSVALFDILNQRLVAGKPTVISTNLSYIKELDEMYSDRVISRLWGNFRMLKFFGDDIRVKKKYRRSIN